MSTADALTIRGLGKRFGGSLALDHLDLRVRAGSLHALLGGNGSGKSTTVKILAGVYSADEGVVVAHGKTYDARHFTPDQARHAGLRFLHQDLGLFEALSVAENLALDWGFPQHRHGGIAWRKLHRRVGELLEKYSIDAEPSTLVAGLRPATQAMVAIARALDDAPTGESILILDEPTAALSEQEAAMLLRAVRRRIEAGQSAVLISHRLSEVMEVADDITVLRDGRTAGTLDRGGASERSIVELMAGSAVEDLKRPPATSLAALAAGPERLKVVGLHAGPVSDIHLSVRAGEILGLAGLVGSGRSTLLRTIFGDRRSLSGAVHVGGSLLVPNDREEAMRHGIAYVPQDRSREAAFTGMDVMDNISAAVLGNYWRRGLMRRQDERRDTAELLSRFRIKATSPDAPFATLSGGNQQKAILARWLRRKPAVLLLDEPTQGVDVVARAEIYRLVRQAAADGCAVLVASSDFQELASLCHSAVVIRRGRLTQRVHGADLSEQRLTELVQAGDLVHADGEVQ